MKDFGCPTARVPLWDATPSFAGRTGRRVLRALASPDSAVPSPTDDLEGVRKNSGVRLSPSVLDRRHHGREVLPHIHASQVRVHQVGVVRVRHQSDDELLRQRGKQSRNLPQVHKLSARHPRCQRLRRPAGR